MDVPVSRHPNQTLWAASHLFKIIFLCPPETQYWQLANLASNAYFNFMVEGHAMTVLEVDGGSVWKTWAERQLFLILGERFGQGQLSVVCRRDRSG